MVSHKCGPFPSGWNIQICLIHWTAKCWLFTGICVVYVCTAFRRERDEYQWPVIYPLLTVELTGVEFKSESESIVLATDDDGYHCRAESHSFSSIDDGTGDPEAKFVYVRQLHGFCIFSITVLFMFPFGGNNNCNCTTH